MPEQVAWGSRRSCSVAGNSSRARHERSRGMAAVLSPPSGSTPIGLGLTNEVQRRAKRVRCNAGLGGDATSALLPVSWRRLRLSGLRLNATLVRG